MNAPETLNWDLFIGPAPMRPYHEIYTPWNWRGWWDFGTGAFGDMACHILDPVYRALKLEFPDSINGSSTLLNTESAPQAEKVKFSFPARPRKGKVKMPAVDVYWYDGGLLPDRPENLKDGESLMFDEMGGCLFVGTKDSLLCGTGGFHARLLSGRVPEVEPYLRGFPGPWDMWTVLMNRIGSGPARNHLKTGLKAMPTLLMPVPSMKWFCWVSWPSGSRA